MNQETFQKLFADPPSEYRSTPYWIWNTKMTRVGICERLEDFKDKGCGGVVIHARVGLETEYLSEEWFDLWGFALEECKRRGLSCNIYDENHFPPPMAGGHTCAEAQIPYRWIEWCEKTQEVLEKEAHPSVWCGGFPAPDSLHPEVTQTFIRNTYEPYQKRFGGSFGKEIRFFYNDEPGCRGHGGSKKGLPWSPWLAEELTKKLGRDLKKERPLLFRKGTGCEATRFDYYRTLQQIFEENYQKPLHDFCEKSGIAFTGHLWEEKWPAPFDCPSLMSACRWYHIPGVDVLGPMFFSGEEEINARCLFMLKQVSSIANQLGRKDISSELFGAAGYETALDQLAPLAAFAMVHGVTHPVEHMAMQSITGSRKYDFPQTLGPQAAWWHHYKSLTDTMARSAVAGKAGVPFARVLVLLPTTTGWIRANPENTQVMDAMRKSVCLLLQELSRAGIDFDLGDELLMADIASVSDRTLRVGEMNYEALVLPSETDNLCAGTVELLNAMADAEIPVYYGQTIPSFVDGRPDAARLKKCMDRFIQFDETPELLFALKNDCPSVLSFAGREAYPEHLEHRVRRLEDGRFLVVMCNSGRETLKEKLSVGSWQRMSPGTGNIQNLYNGELILTSGEICMLLENAEPGEPVVQHEGLVLKPAWENVERLDPNVLQLDFCDLETGGKRHKDIYVTTANLILWQAQGFDEVPWTRIQYRDELISRTFKKGSGFCARYTFEMSPKGKAHLQNQSCKLAVERPEFYSVKVNGHLVEDFSERWLDENIACAEVGGLLCEGRNRIELSMDTMSPLCDLDRVYLLGDFSLTPVEKGFLVTEPAPLSFGNWTHQGLPFYNGRVRVSGKIQTADDIHSMSVEGKWSAGAIGVSFNGGTEHPLYNGCLGIAEPLKAGEHAIELTFYSTPRNLLGPHFWNTPAPHYQRLTGYYSWRWFSPEQPVPGSSYDLIPLGPKGKIYFTSG